MGQFAAERLSIAVQAYATAQRCLDLTIAWVRERETFGRPLVSRQVVAHRLAEMARDVDVARTYTRAVVDDWQAGQDVLMRVAMAKNTAVAACDRVVDAAVQLHGGMGYMREMRGRAPLPRQPDPRHRRRHERDHDRDRRQAPAAALAGIKLVADSRHRGDQRRHQ